MKKIVSAILAASLMFANSVVFAKEYPQKFWDVPKDHWAFEYIADLADRGVINGYDDGSFKPTKTVSRAEWAKMMVDAAGVLVNDNSVNFTDMSNHWANKYVNAAKNYLTGYKDGSYRPDQAATREDVTVAMVKLKGYDISEVDYSNLSKFKDNDSISNYAKVYVSIALAKDLISGFEDNTFRGQATLTRAEAATLLYRAFQKGNNDKTADITTLQPVTQTTQTTQSHLLMTPIEENKSPIATVNTLVSNPGVSSIYNYTTDNSGNLYYANSTAVYKIDVNTEKKEEFQILSDLNIHTDDVDFSDFQVHSMCWDISDNTLLLEGSYKNVNAADKNSISNKFIIKTPGMVGYLQLITANFDLTNEPTTVEPGQSHIVCTTQDGSIVTNTYLIDKGLYNVTSIVPEVAHWVLQHIITPNAIHIDNSIYYVGVDDTDNTFKLYEFNYKECKEKFEFTAYAFGVCNDGLYTITDDGLRLQNWNGKTISMINLSNIDVIDSKPLKLNKIGSKLCITDDKVIFYDNSTASFRILKKNDDKSDIYSETTSTKW